MRVDSPEQVEMTDFPNENPAATTGPVALAEPLDPKQERQLMKRARRIRQARACVAIVAIFMAASKALALGAVAWLLAGCHDGPSGAGAIASTTHIAAENAPHPDLAARPALWRRPLLYRVVTDAEPFYLFGTIHLPDPRLDAFPPALETALQESDVVFTEVPMTPETEAAVTPFLALPPGETLSKALPAPLHSSVMDAFGARGVPGSSLENLKPWVVAIQLGLLDRLATLARKKPLDRVIYERAALAGKVVKGLETPREQLTLFDELTRPEQVELLRQTLEFRERMKVARRDVLGELLDAYVAGNDTLIAGLVREGYDAENPLAAKLLKRLFTDRNVSMVKRILIRTRSKPRQRHFFAVGAGHIVEDDGIVGRLERRGFKVERVE